MFDRLPALRPTAALLLALTTVLPAAGVSGLLAPLKWPAQAGKLLPGEPAADDWRSSLIAQVEDWQTAPTAWAANSCRTSTKAT